MKIMIRIGILLGFTLLCWQCDTDMMEYEGKSGIYFMMQKRPLSGYGDPERFEYVDTTYLSFASILGDDTILPVRVRILGNTEDRDRFFTLRIDEKGTTVKAGEDYDAFDLNQCIRANERQVDIPCRFIKTPKLYQHPDTVIYLALQLEPGADFALPLTWWQPFGNMYGDSQDSVNIVRHVIAVSNAIKKPKYWPDRYWGNFSPKKLDLMCTLFRMTVNDFEKMTTDDQTKALIMGQNLDRYLKENVIYEDQKDENGDWIRMTSGYGI